MRAFLLASLLLLATAAPAAAATKTWDGGAGTNQFNDAANWAPDGVPGADDQVVLDDGADTIRLENGADATIDGLTFTNGALTIAGRRLTLDGGTASTLSRSLGIETGGTVDVDGTFTVDTGGRISLAGETAKLINRADLRITATAPLDVATGAGQIENRSFITHQGGDHQISADLTNVNDGTDFGVLLIDAGNVALLGDAVNGGRMTTGFASTLTVRGGTLAAQPNSEMSGPLAIEDGPLGEHPTVTVADGARFAPSETRLAAGDLVIDDTDAALNSLVQTGGTLRGSGTVGVIALTWSGGTQSGSGTTAISAIAPDPVLSGTKQLARTLRLERDLTWGASRGNLQIAAGGALENAATLTLADDADIDDGGGVIRNLNTLSKPGTGTLDVPDIVNAEAASFTGSGQLTGSLVNAGTLAPGGSPGVLGIGGDYTQTATGTLEIELNGPAFGQFDRLPVTGTATLDGTFAIKRASGFVPGENDAYPIITAASRVGQFSATTGGELPSGGRLAPNYSGSSVQIVTAGAEISIGDASANEGNAGTGTLTFPVLLSEPADTDVELIYRTADGTATAPGDYAETIGSVTIPAGQTAAAVAVPVNGDAEVEPDETFTVTLVTPAAKKRAGVPVITDETAIGMIVNDDGGTPTPTPTPTATASPDPTASPAPSATPSPTPTASPTPTPTPAAPKLADVVKLPSTRKCVSRRNFVIHLRHPKGVKIKTARVFVNGKQVAVRKGKKLKSRVDLRGLPKGRFKVKIQVKLTDGRTVKGTRRYRTCAVKRKKG